MKVLIDHFNDLAELYGHPPKIIWIVEGNLTTRQIAEKLKKNKTFVKEFVSSIMRNNDEVLFFCASPNQDERSVFYL